MTHARRLAVLLAVALPLALAGCGGDSCPTEVAKVSAAPAPGTCTLLADALVTVNLELCTRCNQSIPVCEVVPPSGDNDFQLDTTAQACTDSSSCGFDCPQSPPVVTCRFRTPAVSGGYDFVIVDANATVQTIPFTIGPAGSTTCSG